MSTHTLRATPLALQAEKEDKRAKLLKELKAVELAIAKKKAMAAISKS
jgi:hypothetical protein